jgi:hypothetical protein
MQFGVDVLGGAPDETDRLSDIHFGKELGYYSGVNYFTVTLLCMVSHVDTVPLGGV